MDGGLFRSAIRIAAAALVVCADGYAGAEAMASGEEEVAWGYGAADGPAVWGALSPDYGLCAAGSRQSPIDLVNAERAKAPRVTFHYDPSRLAVVHNGHTVQVDYDAGSYIEVGGTRYDLLQFHFHSPSEHRLAGQLLDMELHLVHRSAGGALAVVGALIQSGGENRAFRRIAANLPAAPGGASRVDGASVDASKLLPGAVRFYRYSGSLTTPPCTEGVRWLVLTTPIEMSIAQIEAFRAVMRGNNRPVRPSSGRGLRVDAPAGG